MSENEGYFKARNEALEKLIEGVNQEQFGGTHYKLQFFQHWDFVIANKLGYFEGQVTKYVCRWREKNGIQDLEKALHYLAKLISAYRAGLLTMREPAPTTFELGKLVSSYPDLSASEIAVIQGLCTYTKEDQLLQVGENLEYILRHARLSK